MLAFALWFLLALCGGGVDRIAPADLASEVYENGASVVLAVRFDGPCADDSCWLVIMSDDVERSPVVAP